MTKTEVRDKTDRMLIDKSAQSDRDYTYFHPSAFGSCPRLVWFELTGVKPLLPLGAHKTRLFDNGHFVHLRHQLYCRDAGVLAKDEVVSITQREFSVSGTPVEMFEVTGTSGRKYPYALDGTVWPVVQCKEDEGLRIAGHTVPALKRVSKLHPGDQWWLVEVPFLDEQYHFGGNCDAIVIDRGEEVVIDWKGTNDYSIPYCFRDEDRTDCYALRYPDKHNSVCFICGSPMKAARELSEHLMTKHADEVCPDFKHIVQLQIYMWQFGLQGAILVHENKNNQMLMDEPINRDEELIEGIKERSERLWVAGINGEKPERPSKCNSRKKPPCMNCDFATQCWE